VQKGRFLVEDSHRSEHLQVSTQPDADLPIWGARRQRDDPDTEYRMCDLESGTCLRNVLPF